MITNGKRLMYSRILIIYLEKNNILLMNSIRDASGNAYPSRLNAPLGYDSGLLKKTRADLLLE